MEASLSPLSQDGVPPPPESHLPPVRAEEDEDGEPRRKRVEVGETEEDGMQVVGEEEGQEEQWSHGQRTPVLGVHVPNQAWT